MYKCEIIADSIPRHADNPHRLTTFVITFPRFILAEFNTHRMLSRNAASSRAIPTVKLIKAVKDDPFIPTVWGANQHGMQASGEIPTTKQASIFWMEARDKAVFIAEALARLGVHKQLVNRVLEPFSWTTVIVTATDWDNFFHLRTDEDAQPQFRTIACMMQAMYRSHVPSPVTMGDWHLPFIRDDDQIDSEIDMIKISAGRCARISYLTHEGKRDIVKDIELARSLRMNGHMSPFEHQAVCQQHPHRVGNFIGWTQYRKLIIGEADPKANSDE